MTDESPPSTVFLFSGQGSQYFQMGKELFDQHDIFRDWMVHFDGIARKVTGQSVIEGIYSGASKGESFDRTLLTHPAIFMVECSLAKCLIHAGITPDATLGASLGSFAAATVSGFMDAEEALVAVIKQALALEACCVPGGMLAVLANPAMFPDSFPGEHCELAAVNFANHFTLSATQERLSGVESALRSRRITYQRLPVSFAFHSRWIDDALPPFRSFMQSMHIDRGHLPLVCCDLATTLRELPADYFCRVIRRPIRFQEAIAHLEQKGPHRYIDLGPAGTLATFLKYGSRPGSASTVHSILTPYGRDHANLAALIAKFSRNNFRGGSAPQRPVA